MSSRLPIAALLLATAVPGGAAEHVRLGPEAAPLRQSVRLHLDPRGSTYSGSVAIELEVRQPTRRIRLHAQELEVKSATLDGAALTWAPGPDDTLDLNAPALLKAGTAKLEITFANEYDRRAVGLYKMEKDQGYLYTQFESIDARKAFPCFDEPGFKIPWQLTLEVPEGFTAVSNTPEQEASTKSGWRRVAFAETKPLPSYLVALAVGEFDSIPMPGLGVPGRIYTVKGQAHLAALAARVAPPLLKATERWFGQPYPYEKLDFIAVPEYWPGAMEHPGAITFADYVLLQDEKTVTPTQRRQMAKITAHELAHQWFGNLVTMAWWDDFWLNETFADWMGDKIADEVHPELGVAVSEMAPVQQTMVSDSRAAAVAIRRPIGDPEDAMRGVGLAYNKGKAVLAMFERWMGPERFREGVRAHLRAKAGKNATSAEFWKALDQAAGRDASNALATFIEQPGLPLVAVERVGANRFRLEQRRFSMAGRALPAESWKVPVSLRWSDGSREAIETVMLDAPRREVTLPAPRAAWVFPQGDAVGYYRWDLSPAELRELAEHAAERLDVAERMAFLGNLVALLDAGEVDGREYLEVAGLFGADPEPEVVSAAMAAAGRLRVPFVTEQNRPAFVAWARRTFSPVLGRIGLEPRPGEPADVTQARPTILAWLGENAEDERVLGFAREVAARLVKDPTAVHPSLAATVLRLAARTGDQALFEEYKRHFEAAATPAERTLYVSGMAGFQAPALRAQVLDWGAQAHLRLNEMYSVLFGFRGTPEEREVLFQWLLKNFAALSGHLPPQFRPGLISLAGGCEPERVARAREFFEVQPGLPGVDREVARLREQVDECVALRTREASAVDRYLTEAAAARP